MDPNSSSPPAQINLEHVEVWYPCEAKTCSRMFYSIPLLKKHFEETHPDEEFLLPLIIRPGTLEGRIIFKKGYSSLNGESVAGADDSKGGTEAADTTPMLEGSKSSNKECGICHKMYENRSARNDHLKKQHGVVTLFDYDASDEELDSGEGGKAPNGEPSRSKSKNGGGRQLTSVGSNKIVRKNVKKKVALKLNRSKSRVFAKWNRPHFNCHICNKSFANKFNLTRHFTIHSGKRPFKCCFCKATSSQKEKLTSHLINVHKQEKETAKALANEAALRYLKRSVNVKGRKTEEPEVPPPAAIACAVLENDLKTEGFKGATKSSNLPSTRNRKVGKTKKIPASFSCNLCPFQCSIEKQLENHSKLHKNGSIAKACEVCGCFVHPSGLNLHKRSRHHEAKANVTAAAEVGNSPE